MPWRHAQLLDRLPKSRDSGVLTAADRTLLEGSLPIAMPAWYLDLLESAPLIGTMLSIVRDGVRHDMQWMNPSQVLDEALNFHPGSDVLRHGLLPCASCLQGSGDPYFLAIDGGDDPAVLQVFHDAEFPHRESLSTGSRLIAASLSDLFSSVAR